jgi:hypothetical protein
MKTRPKDALRLERERARRLKALSEFLVAFEAEHGKITHAEIRAATWRLLSPRRRKTAGSP